MRQVDEAALGGADPGLSPSGRSRAEEMAHLLGDVDVTAGVDAILVAPNRRARDTAMALAMRSDAPLHTIEDPSDDEALVKRILTEFKGDIENIKKQGGPGKVLDDEARREMEDTVGQ